MSRALSKEIIVKTILDGALEASAAYQRLSGGYWVDHAPESFLQAWIALAFDRIKKDGEPFHLMMEVSLPRLKALNVKIDGRSIKMEPRERFDLMLFRQDFFPRCPIEIKKAYRSSACDKDAMRMREWIKAPSSTVDCGFIVAYTSAKGDDAIEKIERRFASMKESTGASAIKTIKPQEMDHEGYIWDVACLTIT